MLGYKFKRKVAVERQNIFATVVAIWKAIEAPAHEIRLKSLKSFEIIETTPHADLEMHTPIFGSW